ncbi:MAG TPA: hypothetical protein VIC03_06400 [Gemmatimonadaceae bacterium]|jgi:hypothetical protein
MKLPERGTDPGSRSSFGAVVHADGADFVAPRDTLFRDPALPHSIATAVLGIQTRLRTNDRRVLAMFQRMFGNGSRSADIDVDEGALRLTVQVLVYAGDGARDDSRSVQHICPDGARVLVHGAGGMAISDPLRQEALVYASNGLVCDEAYFRHQYLEAATLALATHFDRQPLHAAAIRRNDRAVLLLGPSGAGKSTLAYAAHSAGLDVLSEDIVWMQLDPATRIWGRPQSIHLLRGAEEHFPELRHSQISSQPNGKQKITVQLKRSAHAESIAVDDVVVCLLERDRGAAQLSHVDRDEMHFALMQDAAAGFDRYPERRAECAHVLSANGGWRLTLSPDPHDALVLIDELLR